MRAIVTKAFGDVDNLVVEDRPVPEASKDHAVVHVKICGVNPLDVFSRKVQWGGMTLPRVQGSEVAGVVHALPPAYAGDLKVGDAVAINPYPFCGTCAMCQRGLTNLCERHAGEIWGVTTDGGYAEYCSAPVTALIPAPSTVEWEHLAVGIAALTAYHMLFTKIQLRRGETVLVWGATGGVGSAAVRFAKNAGAVVIGTAGTEAKAEIARELGADEVVVYTKEDVVKRIKIITNGRGVDAVVEHTGAKTWETSLAALGVGGRLATCGASTGYDANLHLGRLFIKQWQIFGSTGGTNADMVDILDQVAKGRFGNLVDRVLPLEDICKAHELLDAGKVVGKILLRP